MFLPAQNLFAVELSLGNHPSPLSVHGVSAKLTWVVMELRLSNQNIYTSLPPSPNSDGIKSDGYVTKPDPSWDQKRLLQAGDAVKVTLVTWRGAPG